MFISNGKPEYLRELKLLFSGIEYDDWGFSELHKITLGILPLDLGVQLEKPHLRAQVNVTDFRDRTPLHWASIKGDAYAVENLLLAGANPNCRSRGNDTPLHLAAVSQNTLVFNLLIMAGADVLYVNSWGDTPLNCACNHRDVGACISPLVLSGAKVDHRNRSGETPLSRAAKRNSLGIGSFLLNSNANMRITDEGGETPLFHAIFCGNHEFLKLLLENGDDCTNVTVHGATVLHFTAQNGDIKTASILASARLRSINPDAVDLKGRTAMQVLKQRPAIEEGFEEAFKRLLESIRTAEPIDSEDSETYFDALELPNNE
jgi:ankyrin repeat protein